MAGLDPAIHGFLVHAPRTWMPGTSPGMTKKSSRLFRLQFQRRRIDAVAQACRSRAVVEDVAEMTVAFRAQYLGADHAMGHVALLVDMAVDRGRGKTRPAAAGIELGVGFEQRLPAAGAGIGALALLMLVFAGERPLGRLLAQHRILHRRQLAAPLGLALLDLAGRRLGVGHGISFILDRHCERSEAIHATARREMDCFVATILAMTDALT